MTAHSVSSGFERPGNDINQTCFLTDDEFMSHIEHLQKEKDAWRALYDEKKQMTSKVLAGENSSSEDNVVPLMTDNDLKFMSEVPDYQKVAELYDALFKTVIIVRSQHDKTKRIFNNALQRIISMSSVPNIHKTI
ncbi:Protein of unknown function [Gryllus bimaculatus]|nr:Protein of unknown function [Gryllus bimaculatus]